MLNSYLNKKLTCIIDSSWKNDSNYTSDTFEIIIQKSSTAPLGYIISINGDDQGEDIQWILDNISSGRWIIQNH